ncbi:MAG: histidinol dehydrogenase [Desulfurococcales archaeon]|nr:histidinol dehydrogenase [Desulfurococcales archaeon]
MLEEILDKVMDIVNDIRSRGDEAIRDFYEEFYKISRETPIKV